MTLSQTKKYADKSVSHIYSCYFLQKLSREEILELFQEWKRVIKPGEQIKISVPDIYLLTSKYINSKCKIEEVNKILQDSKIFFDFTLMQKLLTQSGFYAVKRYSVFNQSPNDESELSINGEIISLNVEAYG